MEKEVILELGSFYPDLQSHSGINLSGEGFD